MPYDSKAYLSTPSSTSTEALGVVGEIREYIDATYGKQFYRLVKNATGSDITANLAVVYASGSSVNCALSGDEAAAATVAGITQNIIPDTHYAWVCCGGACKGKAAADVAANALVTTDGSAGLLDDNSTSGIEHCIIGVCPTAITFATEPTGTIRLRGLM